MNIVILQGVSGAGKSTYASRLLGESPDGAIVSANDYFVVGGRYQFDPARLGEAHAACLRKFMILTAMRISPIIVDNTNARVDEIAPYYAIGEACGYRVEIVRVECDPRAAAARGLHGVSAQKNLRVHSTMMRQDYPRRWVIGSRSEQ